MKVIAATKNKGKIKRNSKFLLVIKSYTTKLG